MNKSTNNYYNDFHDEKLKYNYKIADCDDITYKMNELHKPIKIISIMEGGNNKLNCSYVILLIFISLLFLIH